MSRAGAAAALVIAGVFAVGSGRAEAAWPTDPNVNLPVCTAPQFQGEQDLGGLRAQRTIASVGDGSVIITWDDFRNGQADVYAQHVLSSGTVDPLWPTNGLAICTAVTRSSEARPTVVADGSGGAIITWINSRDFVDRVYAQRVQGNGALMWQANGIGVCTATPGGQLYPSITADGSGGAIIAWQDYRSASATDLYAQHVQGAGNIDPAWPSNGRLLSGAAKDQDYAQIVSDGAAGAIVTWCDLRSFAPGDSGQDIYAQRVLANGTVSWTTDGVPLCHAKGDQSNPTLVSDGANGAIVTWQDQRLYTRIYAQRVLANGTRAWTADGVLLSAEVPAIQIDPVITTDGAGGAIVAWSEGAFIQTSTYAQHITAAGALDAAWGPNGVPLGTIATDSEFPSIATDGHGGAVVAWQDDRNGNDFDIYAQQVLAGGSVGWTTNGVPVSTATSDQIGPQVVATLGGNSIIMWTDARNGNSDIYCQGISPTGGLGTVSVPQSRAADLVLYPPKPNPLRGNSLTVEFTLPVAGAVSVEVFDLAGRRVTGREALLSPGRHAIELHGRPFPPGIFEVRLRQGASIRVQRLAVVR